MFKKASLSNIKIRLAISGASGSGKTYSALAIATELAKPVAVIDTERGSASRYANLFDFDVCELSDFHPARYIEAIAMAEQAGYQTIIIDSLSHAWYWELEEVDKGKSSFAGWKNVRPLERRLIDAMISSSAHIITTMRSKTEWVVEPNSKGKNEPKKIGTAPIQTSGIEYEFDIAGEMNANHILNITKSRCLELSDKSFLNPGADVAEILKRWTGEDKEPWKNWRSEKDAIDWAQEILPDVSRHKLETEFATLEAKNGKKAIAWTKYILEVG